jgi:regulator of chromosome condensation
MDCLKPHRIEIKNVKFIASGEDHSFAVDHKDNIWAWGQNRFGQTGYAKAAGTDNVLAPYPMKIPTLSGKGVVLVDGGAHHSAAVTAAGQCFVWGRLDCGQLGINFTPEQLRDAHLIRHDERNKPRICLGPSPVPTLPKVSYVACGSDHTIFVTEAGRAYSTGFNSNGQLGLGHDDDYDVPQRIKSQLLELNKPTWAGAGGNFSMVAAPARPEGSR